MKFTLRDLFWFTVDVGILMALFVQMQRVSQVLPPRPKPVMPILQPIQSPAIEAPK